MTSKSYRFWIIIGIVLLNSIGFSIVLPLLPFLVGKYLPKENVVIGMSALLSVFAVCTFIFAPILGSLSDRFGRKPILIVSLLGSAIGYGLFGIGGALWVLFLGRMIDGITAGNITTLFAYITDSTKPEERIKWFGYVGAAMGIGKIGGPALGGFLGSISLNLPFFITAGLIFLSALAVHFLLPESLNTTERNQKINYKSFNVFSHFKDILSLKSLTILLLAGGLFYTGLGIFQFNLTLFLKDIYKWSPAIIGSLFTLIGISEIVVRAIALPKLLKIHPSKNVSILGLILISIGLGTIVLSIFIHSAIIIAFAVILIISGEGLFEPTYIAQLSASVDNTIQGKLQGINQSQQSLVNILVPLGGGLIYFHSPGILYTVAVVIVIAAILIFSESTRKTEIIKNETLL